MYNLFQPSLSRVLTNDGLVAPFATMSFYVTETLTPASIYTDADGLTLLTNPVVANSVGILPPVYLDPSLVYRVVLRNASGSEVFWDVDEVYGFDTSQFRDIAADVAQQAANAQSSAEAAAEAQAEAEQAADTATAAAISTTGFYPGARTYVPRGITGVGTITGGSAGTNGTFDMSFTGGNFSVNPTGTFTVAGGVVTSATITGPGLYIGASPSAPTVSTSASAGLTGASIPLVVGYVVGSGEYYLTDSTSGAEFVALFQNVSGTATQVTDPLPWASAGQARLWAESATAPNPLDPTSKSAKTWALQAGAGQSLLGANFDGIPWLKAEGVSLTGEAAGLAWTDPFISVAKAIKKASYTGVGLTSSETYYISVIANGAAPELDRIQIRRVSDNAICADSGNNSVYKLSSGVTRRVLTGIAPGGIGTEFTLEIAYSELATGLLVNSLTKTPLMLSSGVSAGGITLAATSGYRAHNYAIDSNGSLGTGIYAKQSLTVPPAQVSAGTEMAALGISRVFNIGSSPDGATAIYKRELAPANPNGKYYFAGLLVRSSNGTNWPTAARLTVLQYTTATGTTQNTGRTEDTGGFLQIDANLRLYWGRCKMPETGAIGSIVYGLDSFAANTSVVEAGGWFANYGEAPLNPETIAKYDWKGYTSSEEWRDSISASISAIQSFGVNNYPYGNTLTNGAGDPLYVFPSNGVNFNTGLRTTPTSVVQSERGVKTSYRAGTAATNFWYWADPVLDATAANQYWVASCYVYSPDGVQWAIPQIGFYVGNTIVGTVQNLSNVISIDANNRLYYGSGQIANNTSLTTIRMGCGQNTLTSTNELGGFQFIRYRNPITFGTTNRDDWYYTRIPAAKLAQTVEQVTSLNRFSGGVVPWMGDSIVSTDFNLPSLLSASLSATVPAFGTPGLRMSRSFTDVGNAGYYNRLSGVALSACIASGDWSDPIAAAADLAAIPGQRDYSPQIAAMAAFDWSTTTALLISYLTNDWAAGVTLGATNSTALTDVNGAINTMVSNIQGRYPTMPIIFGAPMWRAANAPGGDSNTTPNSNGVYISDIQEAVKERCNYYQLPCWEPAEKVGFNAYNFGNTVGTGNSVYSTDGLHPSTAAAQARIISRQSAWMKANF